MATMKNKWDEEQKMMKKQQEEMAGMMEKMKAELNEANETIAAYKNKEEEMVKKEKKNKRMASLLENGLTTEEAQSAVDKFDLVDDDTFAAITSLAISINNSKKLESSKQPVSEENVDATVSEDKTESTEVVTEDVLENVEVEEAINLGIGGEQEDSFNTTRAALSITRPTLCIIGNHDRMTPKKVGIELSSKINNSQQVIIEDSGHMSILETASETKNLLKKFFKENS